MKAQVVVLEMGRQKRLSVLKDQLATFFERFAARDSIQQLLRRAGLDPRQFVVFLALFRTLSEREEFMGSVGVNRFSISYIALFAGGLGFVPWSWLAGGVADNRMPRIPGLGELPESIFMLLNLTVTFAFTFLVMIRETANALFNPVESSMLAHIPIHSPTYAAAKISYIAIAVVYLVLGLNGYPALLSAIFIGFKMFPGARWFFPVTHLLSALLIGLWTAFILCAFYGLMRRVVPAALLKSIAMWIQGLSLIALVAVPIFFPRMFFGSFLGGLITAKFESSQWTWLPLAWFAEIGRIGCLGATWRLEWKGAFSILATIVVLWFGFRSFSGRYLSEALAKGAGGFWRKREFFMLSRVGAAIAHVAAGSPLGIGAFCFVSKMIRRDSLFRRFIWTHTWIPFLAMTGVVLALARFGIPSAVSGRQSGAHVLPHLLGLLSLALCINLPFTMFSRASWIYLTAPIDSARAFAKGMYWALWIPAAGLPNFLMLLFFAYFLNWEEAAFIAGFNLIVVSLYLAVEIGFIRELPFSSPANESRAMSNSVYIQIYWLIAIAIPITMHEALCESLWIALLSAVGLLAITVFVLCVNVRRLEKKMLWRLYEMKMGAHQLFREIE